MTYSNQDEEKKASLTNNFDWVIWRKRGEAQWCVLIPDRDSFKSIIDEELKTIWNPEPSIQPVEVEIFDRDSLNAELQGASLLDCLLFKLFAGERCKIRDTNGEMKEEFWYLSL